MSSAQVIKIVDELAKNEVFCLTFSGGEPLMCKDVLQAGIRRAREYGIVCAVNTNLQLLTRDVAKMFLDNDVALLTSILSSEAIIHDSIANLRGGHAKLLRNIRFLADMGVLIGANMVVRSDNAHQVYETGKLACELGVMQFSATKVAPSPGMDYLTFKASPTQIRQSMDDLLRINEEFKVQVEILETYPLCFFQDLKKYSKFIKRNCTAAVFNCSISPDGNVRPCAHADMSYGNVFVTSFQECWDAMNDWRNGDYLNAECRECKYLLQCTGGCRIDAKHFYGDIRGKDPLMTHPSKVIPLKEEDRSSPIIPEILTFNPQAYFRDEDFGGIVKFQDEIVLLSPEGLTAIKLLHLKKSFSWQNEQMSSLTAEEKIEFFDVLHRKKILL